MIEETLKKLGELIIRDYTDARITQQEQVDMLALINHLTLKDFVRPVRKEKNERSEISNTISKEEQSSGTRISNLPDLQGSDQSSPVS